MEYLDRITYAKTNPDCAELMFRLGYDVDELDKDGPDFHRAMVTIRWHKKTYDFMEERVNFHKEQLSIHS